MDSMDVNEITKVIDGVYKNITDNFNPSSKQMIATGKAYLKSLHGASAACSMYLEALVKLSKQAQQSSVGTSLDIGSSMMQIADVFKEIHTQQLTTLKAFYVDFLVPLETNLEKDVKVIQNEQKKFLVSHKHRVESYNKAVSNAKKVRKKSKKSSAPSSNTLDKEIRIMQTMEEERSKLEAFCEEALREALTQERRRYGFILERQASLAKHYLAFYSKGSSSLGQKLDGWMKVAKSREALPDSVQTDLVKKIQGEEECIYCSPRRPADDTASISSQLRKTKSMEAGEMLNIQNSATSSTSRGTMTLSAHHHRHEMHHHHADLPITSAGSLSRAKSDTSLGMSNSGGSSGKSGPVYGTTAMTMTNSGNNEIMGPLVTPPDNFRPHKSMASLVNNNSATQPLEQGHVGYAKALFAYLSNGDNQLCFLEGDVIALIGERNRGWQFGENLRTQKLGWFPLAYTEVEPQKNSNILMTSESVKGAAPSPVPPPMPPPVPSIQRIQPQQEIGGNKGKVNSSNGKNLMIPSNRTNDSLHSSNDSGISNDVVHQVPPPPQPEVDYSDEEPHLSNSEEIKPGTKWLMDRYHMSETARMNSSTRRRSLSSGNLSTGEQDILRTNNIRNASFHNGAGSSPRGPHHQLATTFYDESGKDGGKPSDAGPLKKFLNRTKSLIWRRPSNAGDQYQQDGLMNHHPQRALESISIADTASELWGSHSSIVEMTEFEMKELSSSSHNHRSGKQHTHNHHPHQGVDETDMPENEFYASSSKKRRDTGKGVPTRGGKVKEASATMSSATGPSLPPRNSEHYGQRSGQSTKMQMSPGSSSLNTNASTSTSNMSMPLKEADSCLVISDHTRTTKNGDIYESYRNSGQRSKKENDIDMMIQSQRSKASQEKVSSRTTATKSSSSHHAKSVARVESFAVSEAPIIPDTSSNKFSRRSIASGSVALSSRTNRSRVATGTGRSDPIANGSMNSNRQSNEEGHQRHNTRRRLWDSHANDDSYNSDNGEEVAVDLEDEEDDDGTIDFEDNDHSYDDEASSSVFIEAEHQEEHGSGSKSMSMIMIPQKLHQEAQQQPKSIMVTSSSSSKRSKSSDIRHSGHDTRRSRSTSVRSGVDNDTVEMPKRHGGFIREKTRSVTKSHNRSSSSPPRSLAPSSKDTNNETKRTKEVSRSSTAQKSSQKGPTYKGRPIGSPPPIPAPQLPPQQQNKVPPQQQQAPPPPPPLSSSSGQGGSKQKNIVSEMETVGELTEAEPDYGTIKGSPTPPRKEALKVVPYDGGRKKHQSLVIRDEGRKHHGKGPWKGSIRSEIHTVELITTDVRGDKPVFDYGSFIHRRLYYPDRGSRLDQKSERSGNYCGPWYDLWGEDPSVSVG